MVDMSAIVAAGNSFKIAVDIARGIQSLKTSTEVREKTSALLDAVVDGRHKLLDASEAQATLLARIKELEEKIAGFENWNSEKERYQLQMIDEGAFAYVHKLGMENSEPAIWLCAQCFDHRHRSLLQRKGEAFSAAGGAGMKFRWACSHCQSTVDVGISFWPGGDWDYEKASRPKT